MARGSVAVNGFVSRIGTLHDEIASGSMVGGQGSFSSWIASRWQNRPRERDFPGAHSALAGAAPCAGSVASRVDQACPDLACGHSSTESLICAPKTVA